MHAIWLVSSPGVAMALMASQAVVACDDPDFDSPMLNFIILSLISEVFRTNVKCYV